METLQRISGVAGKYFALWVLLGAVVAFFIEPLSFLTAYVNPLLGIVMFGMGLTLTGADFARVFKRPKDVALGVAAQFTIMPLVAFALAYFLRLPPELAVGVVLLGCCPGGTASIRASPPASPRRTSEGWRLCRGPFSACGTIFPGRSSRRIGAVVR